MSAVYTDEVLAYVLGTFLSLRLFSRLRALSTMGDPEGVATQLATLLQRPAVVTAIGAARASFLAGT